MPPYLAVLLSLKGLPPVFLLTQSTGNFWAIVGSALTLLTALVGGFYRLKSNQERLFRAQQHLAEMQARKTAAETDSEVLGSLKDEADLRDRLRQYDETIRQQARTMEQQQAQLTVHAGTIKRLQEMLDAERGGSAALGARLNQLEQDHRLLAADRDAVRTEAERCAGRTELLERQLSRLVTTLRQLGEPLPDQPVTPLPPAPPGQNI